MTAIPEQVAFVKIEIPEGRVMYFETREQAERYKQAVAEAEIQSLSAADIAYLFARNR
jgi:hypothetical protein